MIRQLLTSVKEESAKEGLNYTSKVMASGHVGIWVLDGQEMEMVTDFNGYVELEIIERRIQLRKSAV